MLPQKRLTVKGAVALHLRTPFHSILGDGDPVFTAAESFGFSSLIQSSQLPAISENSAFYFIPICMCVCAYTVMNMWVFSFVFGLRDFR